MGFIELIRSSWRETLDVKEADDLPYVLLTEVINQSVLRGATSITVIYDGKCIFISDNAEPFEEKLETLLHPSVGMMNDRTAHIHRLSDRQWCHRPFAFINALCKNFKFASSDGDTLKSVICEDGEVTSSSTTKVGVKRGNVVTMEPMLFMDNVSADFMGDLLDYIGYNFPKVTILFKSNIEEAEEYEDEDGNMTK